MMICEDNNRFRICYDYVKKQSFNPETGAFYDKKNASVWYPDFKPEKQIAHWGSPIIDKNGVFPVPQDVILPQQLIKYINGSLNLLYEYMCGMVYVPFMFLGERLCVGIMIEEMDPINLIRNKNYLPTWMEDFKKIFPQNNSITFC